MTVMADIETPFFVSITSRNLLSLIRRLKYRMNLFKLVCQLPFLSASIFVSFVE